MQNIDAVLYINLPHRTDRNEHILEELKKLCINKDKIHRINGIHMSPGQIGCGLSHIKALEYAKSFPEWKYILIFEDDFTFKDNINIDEYIQLLYDTDQFDMGLLSHNKLVYTNTKYEQIKKVKSSLSTSSYIIKKEYIPILLQNFLESIRNMQSSGVRHQNCIDVHWQIIQENAKWYCIYPSIGYQYKNFSDITRRIEDYKC